MSKTTVVTDDITMPIKYIGLKEEQEDVLYGTGLWKAGEVKQVDVKVASYLLFHPDVYEDARTKAQRKKEPVLGQRKPQTYKHDPLDQVPALANLPVMDKKALAEYAQREFAAHIETSDKTDQQVRDEVRDLMRLRA